MSEEKKSSFTLKPDGGKSAAPVIAGKKDVKKRWMMIGGLGMGGFIVAMTMMGGPVNNANEKKQEPRRFNVAPIEAEKRGFEASTQRDIEGLKGSVSALTDTNQRLLAEMERLRAEAANRPAAANAGPVAPAPGAALMENPWAPPKAPTSTAGGKDAPAGLQASAEPANPMSGIATPPKPPAALKQPVKDGATSNAGSIPGSLSVSGATSGADVGPVSYKPETDGSAARLGLPSVDVTKSYEKNPSAGLLLPGFAPVALLHGLDAEGGSNGQANPQPVMLRIQDHSILPGSARYQLQSCFLLAAGWANMSMQRVLFRLSNITCVDKNQRLVLDQPVKGYLVDGKDAALGMYGEVTERQGAKLWRSTLAGFAQGMGNAFNTNQSSVLSSLTGGTAMTSGQTFNSSALSGASNAAGQIAQYYLQEAQSIFPVISVAAGRMASVVFTEKVQLKWNVAEGLYTESITPKKAGSR